MFCSQNSSIKNALNKFSGSKAFELMHQELDKVWDGVYRILKNGGFACINIGDATRTLNGDFCLYSNHTRILHYLLKLWCQSLNCELDFSLFTIQGFDSHNRSILFRLYWTSMLIGMYSILGRMGEKR